MEKKTDGFPDQKAIIIPNDILRWLKTNPITCMLHATDVGYYPNASGHYVQREDGSRQNILIYCCDGKGWYDLGKGKCTVKKNDFFIIEAGKPHTYGASADKPWSIYWVHFTGDKSDLFSPIFNKTIHIDESPSARFSDRIQLFNEILTNLEMGYSIENMEYITMCLWYLLSSFRYVPQFCEINKPKTQDVMQRTINLMKSRLYSQLDLEEMAANVNYSPSYFSCLFTDKAGMSPINYFNLLKIQKACQLLDFTDMKIKEVAFKLSFNDPYYFSKVFTKYMHMSPKDYREKTKG